MATLGAPDAFDTWALERDRRDDYVLSTEPARSVPAAENIVGYEDLDKYGTWRLGAGLRLCVDSDVTSRRGGRRIASGATRM